MHAMQLVEILFIIAAFYCCKELDIMYPCIYFINILQPRFTNRLTLLFSMTNGEDVPYNSHYASCNHYLVTMNANENIIFCNTNFSNKFADDATTSNISSIVHQEHIQSFRQHFQSCLALPGQCLQGTSMLINQHDQPHHIKWEMVAERKDSKELNVYLVGHDLHENPSRDNDMELSRKILKAIFDSTDNVKFFISPTFKIQFFNKPAFDNGLKRHGKRMQIGDNILDYVRDIENKIDHDFQLDFDKALRGETILRETEMKYKSDKSHWFRTEYYPVYEDEILIGVSVTVSDLTERKKYEKEIEVQNEKLRKIAFIQSHQVRQPLANILGILSLINTSGMSDDDKYLMKLLHMSSQQLDKVVRNIVMEAQQIELYSEYYTIKSPRQKA